MEEVQEVAMRVFGDVAARRHCEHKLQDVAERVSRTMACWNLLRKVCFFLTALMFAQSEESASHPHLCPLKDRDCPKYDVRLSAKM